MVTKKDKTKKSTVIGDLKHTSIEVARIYITLTTISDLTRKTRKEQKLTQGGFITVLSEKLPGVEISEKVVNHWESGRQAPAYLFLVGVVRSYGDWRYDWALGCLQALRPDLWGMSNQHSARGTLTLPFPGGRGSEREEA